MTTREVVAKLIEVSDIPNKDTLINSIDKIPAHEIGEDFKSLEDAMGRIIDSNHAHARPEVAERIRNSVLNELTQSQIATYKESGFDDAEIAELQKADVYQRAAVASKMLDKKLQAKYSVSQSQREIELEAQRKNLEDKLNAAEKHYVAAKEEFVRQQNEVQRQSAIRDYVKGFQMNEDVLTPEKRVQVALEQIEGYVKAIGGRIILHDGQLLVRKEGTSDVLLDGNVPLNIKQVTERALRELNLLKTQGPQKPISNIIQTKRQEGTVNRAQQAYLNKRK